MWGAKASDPSKNHASVSFFLKMCPGLTAVDAEKLLVHDGSQRKAVECIHADVIPVSVIST
jgi:hypothetical protein